MAKKKQIPDELYISSYATKYTDSILGTILDVRLAFAVDASNEKRVESARGWAQNHATFSETTTPNKPFGARIIDWQSRTSTDVVKVLSEDNYLYDMRMPTFIKALRTMGINNGGEFNGKFVWGMHDNRWELIAYDGDVYNNLIAEQMLGSKKIKEYVIGNVYGTSRSMSMYMGEFEYNKVKTNNWIYRDNTLYEGTYWNYNHSNTNKSKVTLSECDQIVTNNTMVFTNKNKAHGHYYNNMTTSDILIFKTGIELFNHLDGLKLDTYSAAYISAIDISNKKSKARIFVNLNSNNNSMINSHNIQFEELDAKIPANIGIKIISSSDKLKIVDNFNEIIKNKDVFIEHAIQATTLKQII